MYVQTFVTIIENVNAIFFKVSISIPIFLPNNLTSNGPFKDVNPPIKF